jgi:translation initiation factor 1 (eIF-1/SUI1)
MHQEVSIIENANFFQVDIQVVDRELKVRFAYFTLNLVYTKPY